MMTPWHHLHLTRDISSGRCASSDMLPRIDGPEVALSNGVRSLNIEDPPFSSGDPGPSSTLHRNALNHHTSKAPQPSASENVWYAPYRDEAHDLQHILDLVHDELSEP